MEEILNTYLIPDLTLLVLSYAWPKTFNFYENCSYGNYKKVRNIIETNYDSILVRIDYDDIVSNKTLDAWDRGLFIASYRGYADIIKYMFEKDVEGILCWELAIKGACETGCTDIVKLVLSKYKFPIIAFDIACDRGHTNIVKLLIENGANSWNLGLNIGCSRRHMNIINLMIENGANYCHVHKYNVKECLGLYKKNN